MKTYFINGYEIQVWLDLNDDGYYWRIWGPDRKLKFSSFDRTFEAFGRHVRQIIESWEVSTDAF